LKLREERTSDLSHRLRPSEATTARNSRENEERKNLNKTNGKGVGEKSSPAFMNHGKIVEAGQRLCQRTRIKHTKKPSKREGAS